MGMVEEVSAYLAAQIPATFTVGTNLFLNFLPDEPATAAAIFETPGRAPDDTFGQAAAIEMPRFQLVTRSSGDNTGPTIARANIDAAWLKLHGVANQTLSGSTYLRISAVQSPFLLDRDPRGRVEFAANFEVLRRR